MLQEWLNKYYDFFGKEIPELVNTDIEERKLIELIQKAIYIDMKPLTLSDLANVAGEFDIIDEGPEQRW